MKRLRGFIILLYIFLTVLVLIIQPAMHKPVTLEKIDFKIKDQLINPQPRKVSDYTVNIKFARAKKTVAARQDNTIHIKPEEDKHISLDLSTGAAGQETTITLEDNLSQNSQDLNLDLSHQGGTYSEREIGFDDKNLYREDEFGLENQENIRNKDMEVESDDIPETDVQLNAKDEIGSWRFRGTKEEIIAWNVWRSNLQNRIMDESGVEAPVGTLILFSFDVSSSGKITNLRYTCSDREYARAARADMVKVLRKLEGDAVLNFPDNTKRKNVKFKGGFLLDYTTQYSSPEDYSDYERIRL